MIGWTLAFLLLLIVFNVKVGGSIIIYPPLVFTTVWFAVLGFYATGIIYMFPLHAITYLCVALGCLAFSLGGAASFLLPDWMIRPRFVEWSRSRPGSGRKFLTAMLLLLFPVYLFLLYRSGTSAGSFSLASVKAAQLASLAGEESEQTSFISLYPQFAFWTGLIVFLERRDRLGFLCAGVAFVSAALSAGRTIVLQLIIGLVCIYLVRSGKASIRAGYRLLLTAGAIFIGLASALVFATKNMAEVNNDAARALQFYVFGYVVSGLGPLDYVLNHPVDYLHAPHRTFKFVLQVGKALGLGSVPPPALDDYLWIPFPTNVYTIFKAYLTDFGFYGMLVAIFLLAFLQTAAFRRAMQGAYLSLLLTSLVMYATVLAFFDDLYIQIKNFGLPLLLAFVYFAVLNRMRWDERFFRLSFFHPSAGPDLRFVLPRIFVKKRIEDQANA